MKKLILWNKFHNFLLDNAQNPTYIITIDPYQAEIGKINIEVLNKFHKLKIMSFL